MSSKEAKRTSKFGQKWKIWRLTHHIKNIILKMATTGHRCHMVFCLKNIFLQQEKNILGLGRTLFLAPLIIYFSFFKLFFVLFGDFEAKNEKHSI
jgi:hypothetical protein